MRDGLPGPCPGSLYEYSFTKMHTYCTVPTHWCLRIICSISRHLQSCLLVFVAFFFFSFWYASHSSQILATTHFIRILNWEITTIKLQINSSSDCISWRCPLVPCLPQAAVSLVGLCVPPCLWETFHSQCCRSQQEVYMAQKNTLKDHSGHWSCPKKSLQLSWPQVTLSMRQWASMGNAV